MKSRPLVFLCAALVLSTTDASAQASAYIPLDHWAMPLIEHLIGSGVVNDPDPLSRPLRRNGVAVALASVDRSELPPQTVALLDDLWAEFGLRNDGLQGAFDGFIGIGARTHARRDPLFPAGEGGFVPEVGFHLWVTEGPLTLSTGGIGSSNIQRDPDYTGIKDFADGQSRLSARGRNAYASVETSWVEATFGNLDRNWGPQGFHGLLFSNAPYSYDHLTVRLKSKYVWVETAVSQLDDITQTGETHQRYWIVHRITGHLTDWFKLWVNQGTLLTGPNRQLETWALNPFRINHFTTIDEDRNDGTNNLIQGAFWLRLHRTVINGSLALDDFAFFAGNPIPNRFAGTLAAHGPLGNQSTWSAGYTFVSNLAYRTARPVEGINRRGVGLGRNFSDYDQLTVRISRLIPLRTLFTGEITVMRHGEGDIRLPFPTVTDPRQRFIHHGVMERLMRFAVGIASRPYDGFSVRGSAGIHALGNAGNVEGASKTVFVGKVAVRRALRIRF